MADATSLRTVEDRLRGARRAGFVGREAELELFRSAIDAPEPPFSVLWVHGPGGVGKTSLLSVLAEAAETRGRAPVRLDLRRVEPSPPAFLAELERTAGGSLEQWERPVLLLDTFEAASALEGWLRESFLPGLPAGAVVVIAGRGRPTEAWRRDPGWRDLLRLLALRNLAPDEARELLARAGVSGHAGDRLVAITHGHPLALSLLLDVRAQGVDPVALDDVPDIVGALVAGFLAGVPSPRHRRALEIVAHARVTTGGLLGRILGEPDGPELLGWLRGLSFIESGSEGVLPHDLARDVIDADLRWRDPGAYREVHRAVREDVVERLTNAAGRAQQRALADLMYLHRGNPAAAALWDWDSLGSAYADAARPEDADAVAALVERHEGPESAALARHWLRRRPADFAIVRGAGPEPLGVLALLMLQDTTAEDRAADPLARAAWEHARTHTPPRPGDEIMLGRFLVDRDAYQAPSPTLNLTTMVSTREWLRRPRLSWGYIACADPDTFGPLMAYVGFTRAEDADAEVGGRRIAVFARDWRREGPFAWLERMGERELGGDGPRTPPAAPELALSRPAFAQAVRDALRDLHRPAVLARNPLVRTRVAGARVADDPSAGLRALLEEAVATATADPRDAKLARALNRTYLRPAPTQEAAAELLGLPFSTYRGHLTRGLERVTDLLWERELYGRDR
jgi:hypothetical protein